MCPQLSGFPLLSLGGTGAFLELGTVRFTAGSLSTAQHRGVNAAALFDLSGGTGRLSDEWPSSEEFCGYAGGLTPDNVVDQLERIGQACCYHPIWIDVESGVRDSSDRFRMDEVERFIEAVLPYVIRSGGVGKLPSKPLA